MQNETYARLWRPVCLFLDLGRPKQKFSHDCKCFSKKHYFIWQIKRTCENKAFFMHVWAWMSWEIVLSRNRVVWLTSGIVFGKLNWFSGIGPVWARPVETYPFLWEELFCYQKYCIWLYKLTSLKSKF